MTLINKITPYILALGIGTSTLTGCTIDKTINKPVQQTEEKEYATLEEAMDVLGLRDSSMIQTNLPDGYKTSIFEYSTLRALAGIYAGTVKLEKVKNGYTAKGFYSQFQNPNAMRRVLKEADIIRDKIITEQEVRNLAMKIFKENTK